MIYCEDCGAECRERYKIYKTKTKLKDVCNFCFVKPIKKKIRKKKKSLTKPKTI